MKNFADTESTAATITRANNGWVANSRWDGPSYIATSLHELATMVEGPAPAPTVEPIVSESTSFIVTGWNDLHTIPRLMEEGQRIAAIKALRACTVPMMTLRAAKDLLEAMFPR